MQTYRSRLTLVLAFAALPSNRKRWKLAWDIDRSFAIEFRAYLFNCETTPNGRPGANPRRCSARQIYNIQEAIRGLLHWAASPEIRLLPANFVNPFTRELVGERDEKDPMRKDVMPLEVRVQLASSLDCWQLSSLGLAMALPLRPDELTAILISDIDLARHELRFRTRLGGGDFNKGRQSFILPLPEELDPLILSCIDGRGEGPLLCRRAIWEGSKRAKGEVFSSEELQKYYERALAKVTPGSITTEQDRKGVFRSVLRELGGVRPDELASEFKTVAANLGLKSHLYELRHGVTTDMYRAGVRHLELRYLTSHTTRDILNQYVSLDPHGEMGKYVNYVKPLLNAILARGDELGCLAS